MHHGQVFYLRGPSWRVKGHTTEETTATEPEASA